MKDERKRRLEFENKYLNLRKTLFYVFVPLAVAASIYIFVRYFLRRFI